MMTVKDCFKKKEANLPGAENGHGDYNSVPAITDIDMLPPKVLDSPTASSCSSGDMHQRETWSRKIDFLFACIGFSVGLGNIWRFPYLCYKNGGGAFLLPYMICVAIGGVPLFFLEVAVGQFMSTGGTGAWQICPLFKGIGIACAIIVFFLNCYYNVILCWGFYYLFSSFTAVLPWSHCNNSWNTDACTLQHVFNGTTNDTTGYNSSLTVEANGTSVIPQAGNISIFSNSSTRGVDPVIEFWEYKVLAISNGIDEVGTIKWDLALCLLLAWILVYFCIWKGIKSSGKVMYFTAPSPYILMTVLLIRGACLPGAIDGIIFYLKPNFSKLTDMQVWVDAGTQIFFSYSISLGTLTALGSYNKFSHNSYKDSVLFAMVNSGTSIFGGFVIFSVLGYMSYLHDIPIDEVAASGPGLAFIAYPKAVAAMPVAPLWSVLFFIMIILLGLDSQFVGVEGFVTAVVDAFPRHLRRGYRREIFIGCVCIFSFFIGLSMVTNGGMYVFQLFDYYTGSRIILIVALCECIAIGWLYGADRFYDNIEMMYGFRINPYMKYSWKFTAPAFCLVMFVMSAISYSELTYNRKSSGTYVYPKWAVTIGWMLACTSFIGIPFYMIQEIVQIKRKGKPLRSCIKPRGFKAHQLRPEDYATQRISMTTPTGNGIVTISVIDPERMALNECNRVTSIPVCNGFTKTQEGNGVSKPDEHNGVSERKQSYCASNGVVVNGAVADGTAADGAVANGVSNGVTTKDDLV
ncbi:sodium- and chloride-dependent taurine transporter-like [Lineus longissimus]|uniref:sodium- and chloride-dependent taurine transporter-like n=1 Tax=Lineus longissimus TaxID=88925 RepID=UPI002B4E3734